jgi:phytoene dehydrogenase-like protein
MADADIIVIGSGHNGLVAAAYLAVAGRKVLVLERNAWFGGGVVTRELTRPGFRHDQHSMSHIFIQGNPLIANDDLGLKAKYGLEYHYPEVPMMSVFEDGRTLALYRDSERSAAEIARFSQKDAQAFRELSRQADEWLPMIQSGLYSPPAPEGATRAMLDQSREGREIWRTMQMSSFDLLEELFESEEVQMHFARVAGENLVSPDEKSTGIGAYVFLGFLEKYGFGIARGGSGELSASLIRCIEDHGGTVLANADVREVVTAGGRATGVVMDDGTRHTARDGVIGAIHPHLLPQMVPDLDEWTAKAAKRTHISSAACLTVHAALEKPLRYRYESQGDAPRAVMTDSYETLRRAFDDLRYGDFVRTPLIGIGSLSDHDPSRAPEGKALFHAWDYVPYDRPDGQDWDGTKGQYADRVIARMAEFIDDLPGSIIEYHCDSPVDMERTSPSFLRGDLHGVASHTYQSGAHRPTPELGNLRVPEIERLYLVGPFQHPGGGVFGAGRATAMVMCEDLDIDFDEVRVS